MKPNARHGQRPLALTIISGLFVAAGSVGLAYHATEFAAVSPFPYDLVWVLLVRLFAVICGVSLWRGCSWARWGGVGLARLPCWPQRVSHPQRGVHARPAARRDCIFSLPPASVGIPSWKQRSSPTNSGCMRRDWMRTESAPLEAAFRDACALRHGAASEAQTTSASFRANTWRLANASGA
jgi:hypothetical protein